MTISSQLQAQNIAKKLGFDKSKKEIMKQPRSRLGIREPFVPSQAKRLRSTVYTSAKLIEIQQKFLQGRHGLHELGGQMESNDTLHGSESVPHWVLGPKNSKFGPMDQKNLLKNFFTLS